MESKALSFVVLNYFIMVAITKSKFLSSKPSFAFEKFHVSSYPLFFAHGKILRSVWNIIKKVFCVVPYFLQYSLLCQIYAFIRMRFL